MSGKIDLNPDQGAKLCDEWKLTDVEADYFLGLISLERAATTSLKKRIKRQLEVLRNSNGYSHISVPPTDVDIDFLPFFSSLIYPALLAALRMNSDANEHDIAERLEVAPGVAKKALETLQDLFLTKKEGGEWRVNASAFSHQSRQAKAMLHTELRTKAHQIFCEGDTEILRFGSVTNIPTDKFHRVRAEIQEFIAKYHSDTSTQTDGNSAIVVFDLDFFRIGRPREALNNS